MATENEDDMSWKQIIAKHGVVAAIACFVVWVVVGSVRATGEDSNRRLITIESGMTRVVNAMERNANTTLADCYNNAGGNGDKQRRCEQSSYGKPESPEPGQR